MKTRCALLALGAAVLLLVSVDAEAFQKEGCGTADCRECHTLTREEAGGILAGMVDNVLAVEASPVHGLWVVDIAKGGRKIPVYIDFSKQFLIGGQVIRLSTKEDITGTRFETLNAVTADPSTIPLSDALVVGKAAAKRKVVVFSDTDCHFCMKLHHEMKAVVAKDPDTAFFVKLYSRNNSPAAAAKARAVICSKSLAMLEDAYAGKTVPPPLCNSEAPEETLRIADSLNIRGTPALVLPDGRIVSGYRDADALMKLISEAGTAKGRGKGTGK